MRDPPPTMSVSLLHSPSTPRDVRASLCVRWVASVCLVAATRCLSIISLLPFGFAASQVEFQRQGGGVSLSSAKTFDLKVLMKSDAEYQFRNISRSEYDNLFSFVQAKGLRVVNLAENSAAGAGLELSDDEDEDPGMRRKARAAAEGGGAEYESEEDEDFVVRPA